MEVSTTLSHTFTQAVQANLRHLCCAPGCSLPRVGIERFCRPHSTRARRYGHPHQDPLDPKLWTLQRQQVADLFRKNSTHPGQLRALDWVSGLMAQANQNEDAYKGAQELARLARHGIKPVDILTELCAVSLYLHENPRAVRDDRAWDFALSAAVFALAPRPRRMVRKPGTPWGVNVQAKGGMSYSPKARASALLYVGAHLRRSLAPFLANVQTAVLTREHQRRDFEAAMSAPLSAI